MDQLRSTFPKTRCNYGDDEQLLLNTYNNIIKARQIMPNMTLLKYNKYNKYQEDDENNGGGSGNDNRRIQWFGPLIRPATPSYISVSEDLTLISVYRRNLHNKKLEEPLKSNIKDQMYFFLNRCLLFTIYIDMLVQSQNQNQKLNHQTHLLLLIQLIMKVKQNQH